jgi:hypothetical protein
VPVALAEFIERPQAEGQIGAREEYRLGAGSVNAQLNLLWPASGRSARFLP